MESKKRKTDHRSRYTQSIIKGALLKLIAEKSINKVSVSELCQEAQISRGTFYNHFEDVYDVSYCMEQDFYEEIQRKLYSDNTYKFDKAFLVDIITLLKNNRDLVTALIDDKSNSGFLKHISRQIHNRFVTLYAAEHPKASERAISHALTYAINGSIGVFTDWAKTGFKTVPEELAEIIERMNNLIFNNVLI